MEQKLYICGVFIFGIIFHLFARIDKQYTIVNIYRIFICGVLIFGVGIVAAYLDKGLNVVINNLTMKDVEFPGHPIPFGYSIIICSCSMVIEKTIIATLKKHNNRMHWSKKGGRHW